jgi:hypothetical protein
MCGNRAATFRTASATLLASFGPTKGTELQLTKTTASTGILGTKEATRVHQLLLLPARFTLRLKRRDASKRLLASSGLHDLMPHKVLRFLPLDELVALQLRMRKISGSNRSQGSTLLTGFSQFDETASGIVNATNPSPISSKPFQLHYYLIILSHFRRCKARHRSFGEVTANFCG